MKYLLNKGLAEDERKQRLRAEAQIVTANSVIQQIEYKKTVKQMEIKAKKKVF